MIALDTNVIVRLVTANDPGQLEAARAVFEAGGLWICKTVFLETEWVLRYTYELKRPAIGEVFRKLLGYPQFQVVELGPAGAGGMKNLATGSSVCQRCARTRRSRPRNCRNAASVVTIEYRPARAKAAR